MELAKEYIKRIDDYLIRMSFEYADIRYEMVDHIASEIEENITDIDDFFTKKGFRGEFLMYMLSQDEKLTESYEKLVRKRSWYDLLFILKAVSKEFLKIKTFILILFGILSVLYLIQYNLKVAYFSISVVLIILFSYSAYIYYIETKKFGKLKVIHSFSYVTLFVGYLGIYIPFITLSFLTNGLEKIIIYHPFIALAAIVFQTLIFIVFLNYKAALYTKYKHLIL